MKTRNLANLGLVLTLSGLPFVGGCTQSSATNTEPALTNSQPAAVVSAEDSGAVPAPAETTAAVPPAPPAEPVLPPNIYPGTPLAEVIKLAQSGVEENVMLSFISNSSKPFGLDAEEIVYLNDLGVSGNVITAMMQLDQGLKPVPANVPPLAPPAPEPVAVAPSYVEPPAASAAPATPVAEAPPTYVSNNYFYDSLAPYGNWVEVEGYGRCWQPTAVVVNRSWQPYADRGRWVYTDAGWYWLSDYTWGATTFHYGRWFSHPSRGWCWWPDSVWAPSWVSWRYSGSYCGWAPLPPAACYQAGVGFTFSGSAVSVGFDFGLGVSAYTFVPWGGFCSARPYQYRVPPHHANQIYHNSTVINNYGHGNNNTVINQGISPDRVREHTRTEVRTVSLRDAGAGTTLAGRRERLAPDGRTLVVNRPAVAPRTGSGEASDRSAVRIDSPRANETAVAGVSRNSTRIPATRNGREVVGIERSRLNGSPSATQVAPSVLSGSSPTVVSRTPSPSPVRSETRTSRESQTGVVGDASIRGSANSPVSVRAPAASARPATVPNPSPSVSQPRVIPVPPQTPSRPTATAPASSLVVIGGKSATRSGGRDYSVWSTPSPAPAASAPASSPRSSVPSQSVTSPSVSSPTIAESMPAPTTRGNAERSVTSRGSYSTFATPSRSAPSYTPRPAPVSPAPGYTPRSAPQSPTPGGQRFESRSVPSQPAPVPAQPASRPSSGPSQRSR